MKPGWLFCAALAAAPVSATAQTFVSCTKTERGQVHAARERAEVMTLAATQAIGPNRAFRRWFGPYTPSAGETVRRNLKRIVTGLQPEKLEAQCVDNGFDLCAPDTFAFVDIDDAYVVFLCPSFFEMDTLKGLTQSTLADGNGTRAGTLIHEVSHFTVIAGTEDHCYARDTCSAMARSDPADALENADNYQYFVEDVAYFGLAAP